MALRDDLMALTPRLRRYARTLAAAGPDAAVGADDLVHATLMRALDILGTASREDVIGTAYGLLTDLNRDMAQSRRAADAAASGHTFSVGSEPLREPVRREAPSGGLLDALGRLRLDEREALLLVAVEGLGHAQAARILRISPATLIARLGRARAALGAIGIPAPRRRDHLRLVR